jgi:hypothetical protein
MRTADQYGALPPVLAEAAMSSHGCRLRWAAAPARSASLVLLRLPSAGRGRRGRVPGRVLGVNSLEDILLQIARCPRQPGCFTGRDGTVRLIKPLTGREDCPGLAFTEATAHGASPPQAARRLLAAGGLSGRALRADPVGLG